MLRASVAAGRSQQARHTHKLPHYCLATKRLYLMGLSATKKLHAYRHTILASLIETTAQQLNHAMLPWEAACFKGLAKLQAATVDPTATKLRGRPPTQASEKAYYGELVPDDKSLATTPIRDLQYSRLCLHAAFVLESAQFSSPGHFRSSRRFSAQALCNQRKRTSR